MKKLKDTIVVASAWEKNAPKDVLGAVCCLGSVKRALLNKGIKVKRLYIEKEDFKPVSRLKHKIEKVNPSCIFNLFEGFSLDSKKEIEFVRVLEKMRIPFTGNSSRTLKVCLDKELQKKILIKNKILVPRGVFARDLRCLASVDFVPPFFIKPCFEDASVGIEDDCLVYEKDCLLDVVARKLKRFPSGLIIEEFIAGREYNAGFLGKYPYELVGVSEVDYSRNKKLAPFMTYDSKWEETSLAYKKLIPSCAIRIDKVFKNKIISLAVKTGKILGCQGYFRVDLREEQGLLFVLDVNPNPDINLDSGFIRQAYYKGYSYEDVVEKILQDRKDGFKKKYRRI